MNRPIDPVAEKITDDDTRQYRVLGRLCLIYGGGVALGAFIPNTLGGRLCFLFVGGCVAGIGIILRLLARPAKHRT